MPPLTVDQEWWISRSWTRGLGLTFSKPLLDIVWLKTLNLALVGRQPNLFRWFWVLYFFYLSFWSRCACVFGCDSSLGFWLLRLVMVVKVLWAFDCWAYIEITSSCYKVVLLFSPFSFILLFSTLRTMWDLGGGEGKMKILRKENSKMKICGWIWFWEEIECPNCACLIPIMWIWFMWPIFTRDYF